jgi:tRNA threonylcarbamoyladenosine biosynthesis protein TsaE
MPPRKQVVVSSEAQMLALGARLAGELSAGDCLLLSGPLGAGKTTLIRGMLCALGVRGSVRSPTFNIMQEFPTNPPFLHVDLYRTKSMQGLGLEDYLDTHLCAVEWAEFASPLVDPGECWGVRIDFADGGRVVVIDPPTKPGRKRPPKR